MKILHKTDFVFLSVFDALPAEIVNSATKIAIFVETYDKTKKVDDTSSVILTFFRDLFCGSSEKHAFSSDLGGVSERACLPLEF